MVAKATKDAIFSLDFVEVCVVENRNRVLDTLERQLEEYFLKDRVSFDIPLLLEGTPFQKSVWRALLEIPYGKTISYKEEAQILGAPRSYRAVANANGKNPISIIIPCHRVVASNGKIGGYSGGVWRKEYLLHLEKRPLQPS